MSWVKKLWKEEDGQALTEYGLLVGLIAVVVIGTLVVLGEELDGLFTTVVDTLKGTE